MSSAEEGEVGALVAMSDGAKRRRAGGDGGGRRGRRRRVAAEECPYGSSDEEAEDEELSHGLTVPGRLWKRMFEHQRTCVEWLWELHRQQAGGIVGDEMGLGKTLQVIAMWAALQKSGRGGASLVVCPATVLRQWQRETRRWAPGSKRSRCSTRVPWRAIRRRGSR